MTTVNKTNLFQPDYAHHDNPLDAIAAITSQYEGKTDEQISDMLQSRLIDLVSEFDRDDYPELTMTNPHHRWRMVSAIQKAIRRGDVQDAIFPSIAIENSTQADSFWRRLGVIVLEDIALANPELVAVTLMVAGKKKWRQKNGGDLITIALIDRMALSVKSRALCNMACWLSASARFARWRETWVKADMTGDEALTYMLGRYLGGYPEVDEVVAGINDDTAPAHWAFATLASGVAAGHRKWTEAVTDEDGTEKEVVYESSGNSTLHEALIEKHQPDLPTLWRYIIRRARGMRLEGLMHAIPAAYTALVKSDDVSVIADELPDTERVGALPGYAYDRHSFEGKRAIATFQKHEPIADYLAEYVPEHHHNEALGFAVFFAEAGEPLSPKLACDNHSLVLRSELSAYAAKYAVELEVYLGLMSLVLDELPALNAARRKAVGIKEA